MKKISLIAAVVLLNIGLVAYATSSGNGNNPPDCCKKSCTPAACTKSASDSTTCQVKCSPKDCKQGK